MRQKSNASQETNSESKTIIVVILLVFAYPIGVIFVWIWKMWPTWVRWVISIPALILIISIIIIIGSTIVAINNPKTINKNELCVKGCAGLYDVNDRSQCIQQCNVLYK